MGWGIDPANLALRVWFCATGSQLDIRTAVSGVVGWNGSSTFGWNETLGGTEVKRSSSLDLNSLAAT